MKLSRRTVALVATLLPTIACGSKKDEGESSSTPATSKQAFDEAALQQLAATTIEGFAAQASPPTRTSASVYFTSKAEPAVGVMANLGKCEMCQKMDLAVWKANANLKSMLSASSLEDPGLVWEVDTVDLGGKQGISTYALAFDVSEDGKSRGGVNSYNIWFNDGVNQIWMQTGCRGPFAPSVTDEATLEATCPRAQQLAAARQVFAAFAKHF